MYGLPGVTTQMYLGTSLNFKFQSCSCSWVTWFVYTIVNLLNPSNPIKDCFNAYDFTQFIDEFTRIKEYSSPLIDPIFTNCKKSVGSYRTFDSDVLLDHV